MEDYWIDLEHDFRAVYHCNALDWIARRESWPQFFRYAEGLEVGSWYYSRLLDDEEIAEAQEKAAAEREAQGLPPLIYRPPLRGFTPLHHAVYDVIDTTRMVNAADPEKVTPWPRPQTARDRIRKRAKQQGVFDIVTKAMGREVPLFAPRG